MNMQQDQLTGSSLWPSSVHSTPYFHIRRNMQGSYPCMFRRTMYAPRWSTYHATSERLPHACIYHATSERLPYACIQPYNAIKLPCGDGSHEFQAIRWVRCSTGRLPPRIRAHFPFRDRGWPTRASPSETTARSYASRVALRCNFLYTEPESPIRCWSRCHRRRRMKPILCPTSTPRSLRSILNHPNSLYQFGLTR